MKVERRNRKERDARLIAAYPSAARVPASWRLRFVRYLGVLLILAALWPWTGNGNLFAAGFLLFIGSVIYTPGWRQRTRTEGDIGPL